MVPFVLSLLPLEEEEEEVVVVEVVVVVVVVVEEEEEGKEEGLGSLRGEFTEFLASLSRRSKCRTVACMPSTSSSSCSTNSVSSGIRGESRE